ncbi:MAG: amidohydrolase family protein [Desulfotomaculaceae bacterium]
MLIKIDVNKNYILKTGLVIDGGQCCIINAGRIFIEDGLIAAITSGNDTSFRFTNPSRDLVRLDLGELTVLPPLVDCHVHLALDGIDFAAARRRWEQPIEMTRQVQSELADTLGHGILAVRDGGDRAGIGLYFREQVVTGSMAGPVIRSPGFALRKPGTYGSFLGRGVEMDQLSETLDQLVQNGVNLVKVIVSGVVSFKEYGRVGPVQYTATELNAIVQGAHARGLPIMAHASSDAAVRLALEAGVDTVEHGYFLSRESLQQMAARGSAWIPTVIPVAARLNCRAEDGGPDRQERLVLERTVDRQLAMINEAVSLGVTLGVGTDAGASGVRHGSGYLEELALYRRAGLAPAEIIRCATLNGARILGLDWGVIKPGRPAALIAVAGNPLDDIAALETAQNMLSY